MPPPRAAFRPRSSSSPERARPAPEQPHGGVSEEAPGSAPRLSWGTAEPASEAQSARVTATLVTGAPGSGRTARIAESARSLIEGGVPTERVLVLAAGAASAEALATRIGEQIVLTPQSFCEALMRGEAERAGIDPFFALATRADRVAMMLGDAHARRVPAMPSSPRSALRALERIDALKSALVECESYAAWASSAAAANAPHGVRSFAEVYREHERLLAALGALDAGSLLLGAVGVLGEASARERLRGRYAHVLIDDVEAAGPALMCLFERLGEAIGELTLACDTNASETLERSYPGASVVALRASARSAPRVLAAAQGALRGAAPHARDEPAPAAEVVFWRCAGEREEAHVIAAEVERVLASRPGEGVPSVGIFVRSLDREGRSLAGALRERAIPCSVVGASEFFERSEVRDLLAWMRLLSDPLERNATIRLLTRPPVELRPVELARVVQLARRRKLDMPAALAASLHAPQLPPEARERIAIFLATYEELAVALEELTPEELVRRVIERTGLRRARLLDASAQSPADLLSLSRIEQLAAHLSRFMTAAHGRDFAAYLCEAADAGLSLDELVPGSALAASPHEGAGVVLLELRDAPGREFDHVFIAGLGGEPHEEEDPAPLVARLVGAHAHDEEQWPAGIRRLLYTAITRARSRVVLCYPVRDAACTAQRALDAADDARAAVGGSWQERTPALDRADALQAAARLLRQELLRDLTRIGGRLGELRLDTAEDISHGVVRYLELLKLAALEERAEEQSIADALPDINARLLAACTPLERELVQSSELDAALLAAEEQATPLPSRATPSRSPVAGLARVGEDPADSRLAAFVPRQGSGVVLSASDVESYRACPLRYKFARVLRIPTEPTPQQRFGIMVHKVLERYHSEWDGDASEPGSLAALMRLLDAAWRRAGFRESASELVWLERAREALTRYHTQLADQTGRPVWFERSFSFSVGGNLVRGRVDRVDRIAQERYELIDYKTGHARTEAQLEGDVQLSLYALAAARAWNVTAERLAYYYVLDNRKVRLPGEQDEQALRATEQKVIDVAEGIRALDFAPKPAYSVCSNCDFLEICPAAET